MTHEELIQLAVEADNRSKSNTHRIDRMEARQDDLDKLVSTVAVMAEKQERMEGDISEIKNKVTTIADKPGKRWDSIIDKVLLGVVGIIVVYMMTKLGF